MEVNQINLNTYVHHINKIESMLNELKRGLFILDKDFQESIQRGEKDINKGRVIVCKTEKELDDFFNLI